jgi:uncharacterized SAM-binding protein YcdF (DUF218 family)
LRKLKALAGGLALLVLVWVLRVEVLKASGQYLVKEDIAEKADVIVVLGGDSGGVRALKGCELLKQGLAPEVWLSGSASYFGVSESQMAREFLGKQGCPIEKLVALDNRVDSTRDEAIAIGKQMRAKGLRSYILVTSNFHTRRSGRVFRQHTEGLKTIVVSSDSGDLPLDRWWQTRHGRRTWLNEWVKTVSYWVGL